MPLNVATVICPGHNRLRNFNSNFQKKVSLEGKAPWAGLCFSLCSSPLLLRVSPQEMFLNEWGRNLVWV